MNKEIYQWGNPHNPSLVFLHGLGSSGLAFGELATYLSEYHVISFDLPGHGYRPMLEEEEEYLPSHLIQIIEEIISANLKSKPFYLIGHSFGADLAIHYGAKYSHQLKGIVLLDGGYMSGKDLGVTLEKELKDVANFCKDVRFPSWEEFFNSEKEELSRWSKELKVASKAQVKEINGEIRLTLSQFTAQAMIKGINFQPVDQVVSMLKCPTLLLHATVPAELETKRKNCIQSLHTKIENLDVESIVGAGHDIFRDAPEIVAERLTFWCKSGMEAE